MSPTSICAAGGGEGGEGGDRMCSVYSGTSIYTNGTEESVHITKVSLLQGLKLILHANMCSWGIFPHNSIGYFRLFCS